jgi:cyclophilin family peptidyl-prolyl cis-trans isomerase
MIQGGNPASKKKLVPVPFESGGRKHHRGSLSMLRGKELNSATSEFFFSLGTAPQLDGKYSVFGHVVEGDEVLQGIASVKTDHTPCSKCGQVLPAKPTQHCGVHHQDRPIADIVIRSIQLRSKDN